ncbi:MAG: hypothetical protein IJP71_02595 [Lachnospiraceae bacterium]|nr:hypothetical protein [Lachnospiraceae bacterium]
MKGLRENISIKLISLVGALILWVLIMNIINPLVNGFVNVPIEVENESFALEQDKTYNILDSRMIRITYKVNSNMQTNIKQSDFRAYIDLNDLAYTENIPIRYEVLNNADSYISNVVVNPSTLHVVLDDVSRNEFRVQYEVKGNIGPGHSIGSVILSPNIVYVAGSNVAIGNIGRVAIDIPVQNNEETFSGVAKLKIYAKDGSLMPNEGLTFSSEDIGYSVVVYSRVNVSLNAVVEGNVKNGYSYAGAQVYPSSIMIDGPRSVIENIYTLDLPVINIEGLSSNQEYKYKVSEFLPIGLKSNVEEVIVNVTVNDNILNRPNVIRADVGPHVDESSETEETIESESVQETSTEAVEESKQ